MQLERVILRCFCIIHQNQIQETLNHQIKTKMEQNYHKNVTFLHLEFDEDLNDSVMYCHGVMLSYKCFLLELIYF